MSKKEFKQHCKAEKAPFWRLSSAGAALSLIGLALLIVVVLLDQQMQVIPFPMQIVGYAITAAVAVAGLVLDLIGEIELSGAYKAHLKSLEK